MNDKLDKLIVYKKHIENKLSSPLPLKQVNRPEQYKNYLNNELSAVASQIKKLKGLE